MQQSKCGKYSARWNNAISNASVAPTIPRFNSELDNGSTINSIPAFLQIISHKHVLPFFLIINLIIL